MTTEKDQMIRVLIVDDQALVRRGFRMLLEEEPDIRVVGEAHDGDTAIRLAQELQPDIILMDEPFSMLDPVTRVQIRREFGGLWTLHDKLVIMVTHDITEAIEFADRIALMSPGRIEQIGTAAELLFRPQSEFVQKFFDGERLQHEWQAARLEDLDLPEDPLAAGSIATKLGLPLRATVAEAITAVGSDSARNIQLIEAFHRFKMTVAVPPSPVKEAAS